MFYGIKEIAFN